MFKDYGTGVNTYAKKTFINGTDKLIIYDKDQ